MPTHNYGDELNPEDLYLVAHHYKGEWYVETCKGGEVITICKELSRDHGTPIKIARMVGTYQATWDFTVTEHGG